MKLKDFFKTVNFNKVNESLLNNYYKTEKYALDFFENNSNFHEKAGIKRNYKVFKNNAPSEMSDIKEISLEGYEKLYNEYKQEKFQGIFSSYKKVFLKVMSKPDKESDGMLIYVEYVKDELNPDGYYGVSGTYNKTFQEVYESGEEEAVSKYPPSERMKNVLYTYAIEFEPWLDWANMEIHSKSFKNVPDKSELAAHILWEMTFCGFSEKAVENQKNQLLDIVKDFESKIPEKNKGSEFNFGELGEDENKD